MPPPHLRIAHTPILHGVLRCCQCGSTGGRNPHGGTADDGAGDMPALQAEDRVQGALQLSGSQGWRSWTGGK
jgi:hypothetical protein